MSLRLGFEWRCFVGPFGTLSGCGSGKIAKNIRLWKRTFGNYGQVVIEQRRLVIAVEWDVCGGHETSLCDRMLIAIRDQVGGRCGCRPVSDELGNR